MGSSGGGWTPSAPDRRKLYRDALESLDADELVGEKNDVLGSLLKEYNGRDTDAVRDKLDDLKETLADLGFEVDRLGFGGSVAKHTYVDGLSDVDSLVYLDSAGGKSPAEVLTEFANTLRRSLPSDSVRDISVGTMAVTVRYSDGTVVQLLPATEQGAHTVIPSPSGHGWRSVRPHKFTEKLTNANKANGGQVIPVIKLAKSLFRSLNARDRLSGYHVEALAVDAFRNYEGRRDRASMLHHFVKHVSEGVLRPTADITGQTVHVDEHHGKRDSATRQRISKAVGHISERLSSARSASDYRALFE